ncbi:hypothetical protein DRE_04329 [Drechslerella stenobrocha 248]|uniref:Phosphoglycerate mutase-like protein n=1 Tax=Drechslerella stenobrocha 248 TaxID=1043628 RepID=W7HQE9_9PEZI|nr:hypothetical protein DRE_04329 [Drechslerella stenobrocha 248]
MPPRRLHLVRHAEGQHNVNWQHEIHDPILTPKGHTQCATLSTGFPYHQSVTNVICSPLKRTIQTTLESFSPSIERLAAADSQWRIETHPIFQEVGEWQCDIGSPVPTIKDFVHECAVTFPNINLYKRVDLLDFTHVLALPDWPSKTGLYEAGRVEERADAARQYLFDNYSDSQELVIVSHGGFLHYLTNDWESYEDAEGTAWGNTDCHSYEMILDGGVIKLKETQESLDRRKDEQRRKAAANSQDQGETETEHNEIVVGGHPHHHKQ